jgi:tetratricopeptide (TPR) repeat protein
MDVEKALYHELKATELDPLSSVHIFDLSRAYAARGDKERATELLYTIAEFGVVAEYLTLDLLEAGNFAEAQALWRDIFKDSPLKESLRGRAIQMMVSMITDQDQLYNTVPTVIIEALEQKALQPSFVGRLYLIMGNIDEALAHYNVSYETGDSYLYYFPFTKTRDHYPDHAGWQAFWDLPGMRELDIIRQENMSVMR